MLNGDPKQHQFVAWLVMAGLLILRIPFLGGLVLFGVKAAWVDSVFEIGTYLLIIFLIWWERNRLAGFHIDALAVIIIIVFKPLSTLILKYWGAESPLTFPGSLSLVIFGGAFCLAAIGWSQRSKLSPFSFRGMRWLLIGIGAGLVTTFLTGFPFSFTIQNQVLNYWRDTWREVPLSFIYQIGYAGVIEEPVFRGFLWGYLLKLGWSDQRIWIFQAFLFTLAHIYYVNIYPILFFVVIPTGALVLGYVAWKSRSIATSMVTHGAMNATGFAFGVLFALLRMNLMQ